MNYAELQLANAVRNELGAFHTSALVGSGVLHLCLPQQVAKQLQLEQIDTRDVILPDGRVERVPYVATVRIDMLGRVCVSGALVLGEQVLLGVLPLADLDLLIEPTLQHVVGNPRTLHIPAIPNGWHG